MYANDDSEPALCGIRQSLYTGATSSSSGAGEFVKINTDMTLGYGLLVRLGGL